MQLRVAVPAALKHWVAQALGTSEAVAVARIADGGVYVDGARVRDGERALAEGQVVTVLPALTDDRAAIDDGQLRVVHCDARLLVVDKPAGLPTQPPPRGGDALSLRVAKFAGAQAYVGELHRLDRDASGLVAYALDRQGAALLAAQFAQHSAHRRYLAAVRSALALEETTIAEPIGQVSAGVHAIAANGVPAVTEMRPLGYLPDSALGLADLRLRTGRSHQIRVHLAWAVGPIAGDRLYGDVQSLAGRWTPRIALHAGFLALRHPDGHWLNWRADPPADFWPDARLATFLGADWPPRPAKRR